MAPLGALPERAAVGDRARMVQDRQRHRPVDRLRARRGAVPRLPVGRGRSARHQRPPAAPLLLGGALEREGPDRQRAPVRAHQCRRQPRRGRQGILLLSRQPANARLHERALQIPLRVPLRRSQGSQPRRLAPRIRARQHGQARGQCVLRRLRRVRQSRSGGHPHPDHLRQPGRRDEDLARSADALATQHLVLVGGEAADAVARHGRCIPARRSSGRPLHRVDQRRRQEPAHRRRRRLNDAAPSLLP